jgi:hypothetical protein
MTRHTTKLQKEKLKRNKAGLRALTKKSVSLKKKKAILQKGGFLGSLLAPIAYVVAPLYTVSSFVSILYHCVRFQALRDHVIPSASDARVTRNGM